MPIIAESKGSAFAKAPEGTHRALCYGVVDIGTHAGLQYGPKRKVLFLFELSDELMEDGRPFGVSIETTLSLSEKAKLRPFLEAWRGRKFTEEELKGFDLCNVLGKPCQVHVIHTPSKTKPGNSYANIAAIMPLAKGQAVPERINPAVQFSITDDAIPAGLPEWIVNKINASQERGGVQPAPQSSASAHAPADSSVPF